MGPQIHISPEPEMLKVPAAANAKSISYQNSESTLRSEECGGNVFVNTSSTCEKSNNSAASGADAAVDLEQGVLVTKDLPSPKSEPDREDAAPDGGFEAWLVVAGCWAAQFCTFGMVNCIGVFEDYYSNGPLKQYSSSANSWITSVQVFIMVFCGGIVCFPRRFPLLAPLPSCLAGAHRPDEEPLGLKMVFSQRSDVPISFPLRFSVRSSV